VPKGGFYGHFADRNALLDAMLDSWERRSTDDVLARVESKGGDVRSKLRRAGALTVSAELLPIDLAIRAWSRHDKARTRRALAPWRTSVLTGVWLASAAEAYRAEGPRRGDALLRAAWMEILHGSNTAWTGRWPRHWEVFR
jgi:AcrR family transcriptional regulator